MSGKCTQGEGVYMTHGLVLGIVIENGTTIAFSKKVQLGGGEWGLMYLVLRWIELVRTNPSKNKASFSERPLDLRFMIIQNFMILNH